MENVVDLNDVDRFAAKGVPSPWFTELRADNPVFCHPLFLAVQTTDRVCVRTCTNASGSE
jgi:hypothetical protein